MEHGSFAVSADISLQQWLKRRGLGMERSSWEMTGEEMFVRPSLPWFQEGSLGDLHVQEGLRDVPFLF